MIVTAVEPKTTKSAMLEILANELGIDLSETRRAMYSQKILSELHDGMVIIVDEAQNFRFDAIDTLRGFADHFRNKNLGTVGIVCMGNDTFRQQFFAKAVSARNRSGTGSLNVRSTRQKISDSAILNFFSLNLPRKI